MHLCIPKKYFKFWTWNYQQHVHVSFLFIPRNILSVANLSQNFRRKQLAGFGCFVYGCIYGVTDSPSMISLRQSLKAMHPCFIFDISTSIQYQVYSKFYLKFWPWIINQIFFVYQLFDILKMKIECEWFNLTTVNLELK